jgi:hypothetical protein
MHATDATRFQVVAQPMGVTIHEAMGPLSFTDAVPPSGKPALKELRG